MNQGSFGWLLPVGFFIALLAVWEVAVALIEIPDFLLPSPLSIAAKISEIPARLMRHTWVTFSEVIIGFCLATIGGIVLAAVTAHSRFLSKTILPLLVISQVVPTIAIAPMLVIWFGPGDIARLTVVFLIAFFPVVVNTTAGLLSVEAELIDLVRGLNASRWKIFIKIRMPNALPHIFTGMRISIALSVIGAVVAEFVAAEEGLGYLVFSAATNLDTRLVFAAVALLAVMGVVLFHLVRVGQRLAVPWALSTKDGEA